jgi:hypothetical protein
VVFIITNFKKLMTFLGGIPGAIGRLFSGAWDGLVAGFAAAVNLIIDGINLIPNVKVLGVNVGIPDIPHWNPGGTTAAPGGAPKGLAAGGLLRSAGMAMVGERGPELLSLPRAARVDPLPRGGAVAPVFGGGVIHVSAPVYIDGRQVGEAAGRAALSKRNRM